jgi:hypothetical protein
MVSLNIYVHPINIFISVSLLAYILCRNISLVSEMFLVSDNSEVARIMFSICVWNFFEMSALWLLLQ